MARYADRHLMRFFRGDAAFAIPDLYEMLEAESYFLVALFRRIVIGNTECFQRVFVVQFMILPG